MAIVAYNCNVHVVYERRSRIMVRSTTIEHSYVVPLEIVQQFGDMLYASYNRFYTTGNSSKNGYIELPDGTVYHVVKERRFFGSPNFDTYVEAAFFGENLPIRKKEIKLINLIGTEEEQNGEKSSGENKIKQTGHRRYIKK